MRTCTWGFTFKDEPNRCGFSLHAATRVPAADRTRLERLCRYANRPPLAAGRLQILAAEQVAFDLKTPWSDGTNSH